MDGANWTVGANAQNSQRSLQLLEGSLTAALSNTVCIFDPEATWTGVQPSMVKELSEFGEIARIDTSLVVVLKCVLVTYFDVRSSQRLMLQMGSCPEPFPPAAHDFRIVRVRMAAFAERVGTPHFNEACAGDPDRRERAQATAMQVAATQYGEVAHLAICGGDSLIEFYDMRAAQMLLAAAGTTASPWILANMNQQSTGTSALGVLGTSGAPGLEGLGLMANNLTAAGILGGNLPGGGSGTAAGAAALAAAMKGTIEGLQRSTQQSSPQPLQPPAQPQQPPPQQKQGLKQQQTMQQPQQLADMTSLARAALAAEESAGCESTSGTGTNAVSENLKGSSRPVRTKVTTKEFSKYDIDLQKIQRVEDPRTTVMIRNLTGAHARRDFLRFLERCGLHERYTFFYMPCKEHRNVPAGFAFVNFATPGDVHKLYVMVKSGFWREFITDQQSKAPAMSYARFQGHDELARHFNSSAVLHEQDPDKRPIFRLEVIKAAKEQGSKEDGNAIGSPKTLKLPSEPHAYGAMTAMTASAADSGSTTTPMPQENRGSDLHAALEKGAKEIAAILKHQAAQAPSTLASDFKGDFKKGEEPITPEPSAVKIVPSPSLMKGLCGVMDKDITGKPVTSASIGA